MKKTVKLIETNALYVSVGKKANQASIAEARFAFSSVVHGNHPFEIRMGSQAINDMCQELGIDRIPSVFTNESVQGMIITPDPTLKPDEWIVGTTNKRIKAVQV